MDSWECCLSMENKLEPIVDNLDYILNESTCNREYLANYVIRNDGYLDSLSKLFMELEEKNDMNSLRMLY